MWFYVMLFTGFLINCKGQRDYGICTEIDVTKLERLRDEIIAWNQTCRNYPAEKPFLRTRLSRDMGGLIQLSKRMNNMNNKIFGVMSDWIYISPCSASCGIGAGKALARRVCINGSECNGRTSALFNCNFHYCPAYWSPWAEFVDCANYCENGYSYEVRMCINGPGCEGRSRRRVACSMQQCPDLCADGLFYDEKCIAFPSNERMPVTYQEAVRICSELNGNVTEINREMLNATLTYATRYWQGRTEYINHLIWLGSTFDSGNNPRRLMQLSNGDYIPIPWKSVSYDHRHGNDKFVMLNVWFETTDAFHEASGIFNTPMHPGRKGITLCTFQP